ncbi:MAG TPA: hypothetical protein V6D00_14760 [Pantanalinema sp.]
MPLSATIVASIPLADRIMQAPTETSIRTAGNVRNKWESAR